jgi:hypothetical protein
MDPNQAFVDLLDSLATGDDPVTTLERVVNLQAWLEKGGAAPTNLPWFDSRTPTLRLQSWLRDLQITITTTSLTRSDLENLRFELTCRLGMIEQNDFWIRRMLAFLKRELIGRYR